jgi:hypothetical protein
VSETDDLTAAELEILKPDAPQAQPPAKEAAEEAPEPVKAEAAPAPEAPKPAPTAEKPPEDAKTAPEPPKAPPKMVPVAELIELRRELAALKRERTGEQPPRPQEPQIPAYETDPAAHLKAKTEGIERMLQTIDGRQQAQTIQQQVLTAYHGDFARAQAADATVKDAYAHWHDRTTAFMRHMNPGATDDQVTQAVNNLEFSIAATALRSNLSPTQQIIAMAKEIGWAPKPKEEPAPVAPPAPTLAQEVARGQQLAANPIANSGATPVPELTAATLAAMSDEDFAQVSDAKWRRAMGG